MIKFESGHIISHMAILSYNLQTSVYLPVCDFLIVDSAQQYRVKQFNLIVCVEFLFFMCVHISNLRASWKITCTTKCCHPL